VRIDVVAAILRIVFNDNNRRVIRILALGDFLNHGIPSNRGWAIGPFSAVSRKDDLASALQSESGADVAPVLHSLLDHPVVPAVSAKLDSKRLGTGTTGAINAVSSAPARNPSCWKLPIAPRGMWTNASGQDLKAMLNGGYAELDSVERRVPIADTGFAVLSGELPVTTAMKLLSSSARDQEPRVAMESLRIAAALGEIVPPESRKTLRRLARADVRCRRARAEAGEWPRGFS
jgi:hypothetical protein